MARRQRQMCIRDRALGKRQFTHVNKDEHIIRMHIGLEDPKDIIDDIKQALKFIK